MAANPQLTVDRQPAARRRRRGGARGAPARRGLRRARQLARARPRPRQPGARRAGAAPGARIRHRACPSRRSPPARRRATCCASCSPAPATRRRRPTASVASLVQSEGVRPPAEAQTLIEALEYHVERQPDRLTVFLYEDEQGASASPTARSGKARCATPRGLADAGLAPGQTVAIMLPTSAEYLFCFYGVLLAGGIPVPLYPPARLATIEDHMTRHVGDPQERRRRDHGHHPGGEGARLAAARAGGVAARGAGAGRFRPASPAGFAPVRGTSRPHRLPAVHLRQHRQSEGRGAHARQPARQRARDGQGGARHAARTCS